MFLGAQYFWFPVGDVGLIWVSGGSSSGGLGVFTVYLFFEWGSVAGLVCFPRRIVFRYGGARLLSGGDCRVFSFPSMVNFF